MTTFSIERINHKNAGIAREWALCHYYNIDRTAHDSVPYDKGSDLDTGDKHISVKASGFTLMAGNLCHGRDTFDSIWNLYAENVHSNTFDYVTEDYMVYEMSLAEFKRFVYAFGSLEHESEKNGGALKIRCRKESKKMLRWLAEEVA